MASCCRAGRSLDGEFVYAVKTTGIYCRPSCPSRQSKRENTIFFPGAADAAEAGYRDCPRCHPSSTGREERSLRAVRIACTLIETAEEPPELTQLASHVGFSASHFHREFKKIVGVTPRQYAARKRLEPLQTGLSDDDSITATIYDAGFGSGSRVYETARANLGMTPGEYRQGGKGMDIEFTIADSSMGRLLVAATPNGICCIELGDEDTALVPSLGKRFPAAKLAENREQLRDWVAAISEYIRTPVKGLDLPLDIQGTAFQHRVWEALQEIPAGTTASYSEIANAIGQPSGQRAVASAYGANKLALAVPCHRVIQTDGNLGGYRWGLERKKELLKRERPIQAEKSSD
ncbi:MAG: bifunctional DNA-binding transcriptional regulator/O6-methylguanine-DNA methyltransferase Ada [Candidatus Rariloculaceae bacterium]